MHAYFGVKFENAVINMQSAKTGGVELTLIGNLGKIDSINYKKIYVAKESEKIFKFKKTDLVKYGFGSVGFYNEISQKHAITEIIYRNGKQFFMPEVEND
jgi:hypothetical protein